MSNTFYVWSKGYAPVEDTKNYAQIPQGKSYRVILPAMWNTVFAVHYVVVGLVYCYWYFAYGIWMLFISKMLAYERRGNIC